MQNKTGLSNSLEQIRNAVITITNHPAEFGSPVPDEYQNALNEYYQYYSLDFENIRHESGYFSSGNYLLFTQFFLPDHPAGTVLLLHGYFDHTGNQKHIIKFLLESGYSVACYDLQGHGLSSGERMDIGSFGEYGSGMSDFIGLVTNRLEGPYYFVGHSTGCAVMLEYLHNHPSIFNKVIFAAPLVRSAQWDLSAFGYFLLSPFIKSLPRMMVVNISSDKEFMHFILSYDPILGKELPVHWVKILFDWNKTLKSYGKYPENLFIIQGTKDEVVDWRYNIPFLTGRFESNEVTYITNGRHLLFNDSEDIRKEVFERIAGYLR